MNLKIIFLLLSLVVAISEINANGVFNQIRNMFGSIFNTILPNGFDGFLDMRDQNYKNEPLLPQYDFIIIGGGSAGCVLASRLSENSKWNVLLLEAGGKESIIHQVPVAVANFQSTASNWGYKAVPQNRACFGMNNRECQMPRGKLLGGSSSINYMIYSRGHRRDFDGWAAAGNPGWSYDEVLPYFKKSENANLKRGITESDYHGNDGPLNVEHLKYRTTMVDSFVDALKEQGLKEIDYNGDSHIGVSYVQATTLNGQRQSSYRTYIYPHQNRKNLHIKIFSKVTKILIDANTKAAYGVNFIRNNKKYSVKARNEIILSSGTFNSPQLLMLSGIGPSDHLQQLNINVIKDLPVGKQMYDHVSHIGLTFTTNTTNQTPYVSNLGFNDIYDFLNGKGFLTLIGGVEALAFVKVPSSQKPADVPDVELIFTAGGFASDEGTALKNGVNLRNDIYDKVYKKLERFHQDHFTIVIMLFHPKSYGSVRLENRNPFTPPIINPNFFEDPQDIRIMLEATKLVINMMNTPAMKQIGVRLNNAILPGCEKYQFASDDYWFCSIRTLSDTLHHQVGTCKMGPENDRTAVVNHELKVHGIKRLRVVDTSIIPNSPTAHTNAPAFMIAEKAADMIKSEWSTYSSDDTSIYR